MLKLWKQEVSSSLSDCLVDSEANQYRGNSSVLWERALIWQNRKSCPWCSYLHPNGSVVYRIKVGLFSRKYWKQQNVVKYIPKSSSKRGRWDSSLTWPSFWRYWGHNGGIFYGIFSGIYTSGGSGICSRTWDPIILRCNLCRIIVMLPWDTISGFVWKRGRGLINDQVLV